MKPRWELLGIDEATWAEVLAVTRQSMERFTQRMAASRMQELEEAWVVGGVKPDWMAAGEWADMQARVTARKAASDDVP